MLTIAKNALHRRHEKKSPMCKLGDGVVTTTASLSFILCLYWMRAFVRKCWYIQYEIPAEQMICLSRDFNHLSAFSITNLSKQITFTPFVLFSPTCFFLSTVLTILFTCKKFALCVYIYISVWVLVYVCESSFSSRSQSFRTNYFSKVNVKLNI